MSLYSFIDGKDDLVARMLDVVMSEIVLDEVPDDWRRALLLIARRTVKVGAKRRTVLQIVVSAWVMGGGGIPPS